MNLLQQLDELKKQPNQLGVVCTVKKVADAIEDEEEKKAFLEAVDSKDIQPRKLANLMIENGYKISLDNIRRHRRRHSEVSGCKCP